MFHISWYMGNKLYGLKAINLHKEKLVIVLVLDVGGAFGKLIE